jgi:hypothetical protein
MMEIVDMVANDPDVRLQSSYIAVVFGNFMSDRDPMDRSFGSYAWTKILWMSCGVLISM